MSQGITQRLLRRMSRTVTVPISSCVHYGAFRYGWGEAHPYETFTRLVVENDDRSAARDWFVEFLRHYRPRNMAQALGIKMQSELPLWNYPWSRRRPVNSGWFANPDDCPDIVTQFCEEGVLWFRIEQEFYWLERAVYSIRRNGWRPAPHEFIWARKLTAPNAEQAYLLLDGNHRVSALSALGVKKIDLRYSPFATVRESGLQRWKAVRSGHCTPDDAKRVFSAYFNGNPRWRVQEAPARLLDSPRPDARR